MLRDIIDRILNKPLDHNAMVDELTKFIQDDLMLNIQNTQEELRQYKEDLRVQAAEYTAYQKAVKDVLGGNK